MRFTLCVLTPSTPFCPRRHCAALRRWQRDCALFFSTGRNNSCDGDPAGSSRVRGSVFFSRLLSSPLFLSLSSLLTTSLSPFISSLFISLLSHHFFSPLSPLLASSLSPFISLTLPSRFFCLSIACVTIFSSLLRLPPHRYHCGNIRPVWEPGTISPH
jgi:hypothetical protein